MNKNNLLKLIADAGYNVGIGAKKHFSSYDMIQTLPALISVLSIIVGILSFVFHQLSSNFISAFVIIFGVIGLYISQHNSDKDQYSITGEELTDIFNQLKVLYFKVKSKSDDECSNDLREFELLQESFNSKSMQNQLFLSDWYAHYKFFWQHQIEWIDEQKKFSFWRDKVPLSFSLFCSFIVIVLIYKLSSQLF